MLLSRTGTGRSELAISVGRKQLGAQLECKADNEAVPSPLTSAIQVQKINLTRMRIIFFTNFLHFSWTSLWGREQWKSLEQILPSNLETLSASCAPPWLPGRQRCWPGTMGPASSQNSPQGRFRCSRTGLTRLRAGFPSLQPGVNIIMMIMISMMMMICWWWYDGCLKVINGNMMLCHEAISPMFWFRFEDNGRVFCEGENDVLEFYKEEPLRADTRLQVRKLTLMEAKTDTNWWRQRQRQKIGAPEGIFGIFVKLLWIIWEWGEIYCMICSHLCSR